MQLGRTVLMLNSLLTQGGPPKKQATGAVIQSLPTILIALHHIKTQNPSTSKPASETDGLLSKLSTLYLLVS